MATLSSLYLSQQRCYFALDTFCGWPLSKHELFQNLKKTFPATLNTNPSESKTRKPAVWSLHSGPHQHLPNFCVFNRFLFRLNWSLKRKQLYDFLRQTYSRGSVPLPSASLSCLHGLIEQWTFLSKTLVSRNFLSFRDTTTVLWF